MLLGEHLPVQEPVAIWVQEQLLVLSLVLSVPLKGLPMTLHA